MATIVNNPPVQQQPVERADNGNGFLLAVILIILAIVAFMYYGMPYLSSGFGGTQVNVPDKIDVNVQQQQPQSIK